MRDRKPFFSNLLPDWCRDGRPDPAHAHRRRFTRRYRRKRECVKTLWIASGLLMLITSATPGLVAGLALATTFASFCILDETA